MKTIPGYSVLDVVAEERDWWLVRARQGERPVLLRAPRAEYPSSEELAKARYGYEVSRTLDVSGVVKVQTFDKRDNGYLLVMEDFGGRTLRSLMDGPGLELLDGLRIASELSRSVGEIHQHHVIHRDLEPSNILVNRGTGQVKIANFDIASRLTRTTAALTGIRRLEGKLAYISPEQTGRMNRAVDHRSDLYSLGVILYEMLAGQPPFVATDPMALVHSHIAAAPVPPHLVRESVPRAVSEVVMKLLAKNAEDRYQSAYGLSTDLDECIRQLNANGKISDFRPGAHDVSSTFQIPQTLYGRELERDTLIAAFRRVSRGATELVLVSGYSGIGKSSLTNEIHKPIVEARGHYAVGKYDQLQSVPLGALVQAFQALIRQILAESEERVGEWRERLHAALGTVGQVIVEVIPELALIIGPQSPVPPLGPSESQNRFNVAFQEFIGVFIRKEHPLVLVLDDLQWADSASLDLIRILLRDPGSRYLLLLGAYRDNEVQGAHPLALCLDELRRGPAAVSEIALRPLELSDVIELIADTVDTEGDKATRELAALVFQKTQGNPFFVNQFLISLSERDLITFNPASGRWQWSLERIQQEKITDNVATLMADKIRKLSPRAQKALTLASCIGSSFDLKTLAAVSESRTRQAASDLWESVVEGLLRPIGEAYKYVPAESAVTGMEQLFVEYSFLHDRVQEAAYSLIPEDDRKQVHLRIGRLLLESVPEQDRDVRIFDIVNQLNRGLDLIGESEERIQLARLNLAAGTKAKRSTAYVAALKYLEAGIALLPEDSWQSAYDLSYALHRERSECDHLVGRFDAAKATFDRLLVQARTKDEKAEIYQLELALYQSIGKFPEAIQAGKEGLRLYGIEIPADDGLKAAIGMEMGDYHAALAGRSVTSLVDSPEVRDPAERARILLLSQVVLYGSYVNPDLFALLALMIVNHSLREGNAPGSAIGYVAYSFFLGGALGDHATAYEFGQVALAVSEKLDDLATRSTVLNLYGGFVHSWSKPFRTAFPYLEKAFVGCVESGALNYASYAAVNTVSAARQSGEELGLVYERTRKYLDFLRRANLHDVAHLMAVFQRAVVLLMKGTIPPDLEAALGESLLLGKLAHYLSSTVAHYINALEVAVIYEDYGRAREMADKATAGIFSMFANIWLVNYRFYRGLLGASRFPAAPPLEQEGHRKLLDKDLVQLKLWADSCPENFLHKYLILAAEIARIESRDLDAMDLYDRAIESATQNELIQGAALANELAGKFHLGRGRTRIARTYLIEARYGYARWGAAGKVAALEKKYEELPLHQAAGAEKGVPAASAASLDLTTVMKASQAISGEIVLHDLLGRLMNTMIENAGAERGILILKGDSPQVVEASTRVDEGRPVLSTAPVEARDDLATGIVRYVERTGERVVLGDAAHVGQFRSDHYVARARPKSVLCMPVIKQKKLVGILYLENNLVTNAFTPERCEVLDLLAAQAAISLENARLYDTLDNRVKERTRELSESNQELSRTLERLKDTQRQLIMQEKLASLGALTSGIAHEIKNPLNFINNFAQISAGLTDELTAELETQRARFEGDSKVTIQEIIGDLKQNVDKINEHGKRADDIVRSMLEHSRTGKGEARDVDLNSLLGEYINLAYQGLRSQNASFNVRIESSYDERMAPMHLVPQEMGRVFLNLMNNACYSANAKRKRLGETYSPVIRLSTQGFEDRVEVRVRDNGVGIPAAVRDKIFNPFFTTKPPGEGTGLGLSISYDIVVQGHGGTIAVETEEGQYAEFLVSLPRRSG